MFVALFRRGVPFLFLWLCVCFSLLGVNVFVCLFVFFGGGRLSCFAVCVVCGMVCFVCMGCFVVVVFVCLRARLFGWFVFGSFCFSDCCVVLVSSVYVVVFCDYVLCLFSVVLSVFID